MRTRIHMTNPKPAMNTEPSGGWKIEDLEREIRTLNRTIRDMQTTLRARKVKLGELRRLKSSQKLHLCGNEWQVFPSMPQSGIDKLNREARRSIDVVLKDLPQNASAEAIEEAFFRMGAEMKPTLLKYREHGAYDTEPCVVFSELAMYALMNHLGVDNESALPQSICSGRAL